MVRSLAVPSLFTALCTSLSTALCSALCAQQPTVVVPAALATVEGSTTGNVWRAGANRVQCIYDSSNFTVQGFATPFYITSVDFRLAGGLSTNLVTYPQVELYVRYAACDHLSPSTTFAANRTGPLGAPSYSGVVNTMPVSGTSPNGYFVSLPLATPFLYAPDSGFDLLIELVIQAPPVPAQANVVSSAFDAATHLCKSVRSIGSTTATSGSITDFCPVVGLGYTVSPGMASSAPYGAGCGRAVSIYEQFPSGTIDLTNTTLTFAKNFFGGYTVTATPGATIVPPTAAGLGLGDNSLSAPLALPFTFDHPTGSTTSVRVDANGSVILGGAATSVHVGSGKALLHLPSVRLAPVMQDLLPDGATNIRNVFAEMDPFDPSVYLITWMNVPCVGSLAPTGSTFQVALIDNGILDRVEFRYATVLNDSTSLVASDALTGYSAGSDANDPGSTDLSSGTSSSSSEAPPLLLTSTSGPSGTGNPIRPVLGTAITVWTGHIDPTLSISLLLFSYGQVDPGVDLAFLGCPNCRAYVGLPAARSYAQFGAPDASTTLFIPGNTALIGAEFFLQAAAFDQLANDLGLVTSNGMAMRIGAL